MYSDFQQATVDPEVDYVRTLIGLLSADSVVSCSGSIYHTPTHPSQIPPL